MVARPEGPLDLVIQVAPVALVLQAFFGGKCLVPATNWPLWRRNSMAKRTNSQLSVAGDQGRTYCLESQTVHDRHRLIGLFTAGERPMYPTR
jgi:hypothetical protein